MGGWTTVKEEANQVLVTLGQGNQVPANVGDDFVATVEKMAADACYGGSFRVFLNSVEILDPAKAPAKIEAGMHIAICPHDKVGG